MTHWMATSTVGNDQVLGARAIAEKNAGGSVFPIHNARHRVGPNDQHPSVSAREDELRSGDQAINEPGAASVQIECTCSLCSQGFLNERCCRGESEMVWRRGSNQYQIKLGGIHIGDAERLPGRRYSHGARALVLSRDAALCDSCA